VFTGVHVTSESEMTAGDRERQASLPKSDEGTELVAIDVAGNRRLNRRVFFYFCVPHWPVFLRRVDYIYTHTHTHRSNHNTHTLQKNKLRFVLFHISLNIHRIRKRYE
jgi:hypothetical protein